MENTASTGGLQIGAQKPLGLSIFASSPAETVRFATELANVLKPIIDTQGMFSMINGKKYPKVEAWLTLGAMLGIMPRESKIVELPDGSYEASVDLLDRVGRVVGGASAICGAEEPRWAKAERYARRSMSVTRATAKSYRVAFSWIMGLAGYEVTPAEEMPHTQDIQVYRHSDSSLRPWLKSKLAETDVPEAAWPKFSILYDGQYMTDMALEVAVAKFVHGD